MEIHCPFCFHAFFSLPPAIYGLKDERPKLSIKKLKTILRFSVFYLILHPVCKSFYLSRVMTDCLSESQFNNLLESILPIVLEKGPTRTTMDNIASSLGISKRTLYEIFDSKDEMLRNVFRYQHQIYKKKAEEIFSISENMMDAMVKLIDLHRVFLEKINIDFFRDMDEKFRHLRPDFDNRNEVMAKHIANVINLGVEQGMFRKNCDYDMNIRLLRIQLESIKRMEDFFPPEITLEEAFNSIGRGFLRNIATPAGIEFLDNLEQTEN